MSDHPAIPQPARGRARNMSPAEAAARQRRIAYLTQAVREGTYWVSGQAIADKILSHYSLPYQTM